MKLNNTIKVFALHEVHHQH